MRLLDAEKKLLALNQLVLRTQDASACLNVPLAQASKILDRLVEADRFVRLMRGKWVTSNKIDPLILPEYLTAPFPSYVSLQTALFYHGMISQIPHTVYAVSLARTKVYLTHFGSISVHHIQPEFFFDYEMVNQVKIATPEKALIDVLYLTAAKSNLFKSLPEVEFPKTFSFKKVDEIVKKIPSARTRGMVRRRLDVLYANSR